MRVDRTLARIQERLRKDNDGRRYPFTFRIRPVAFYALAEILMQTNMQVEETIETAILLLQEALWEKLFYENTTKEVSVKEMLDE